MQNIPDLLTTISGVTIDNAVDWEQYRRKEIQHLFEEYVYGVRDIERPEGLTFKILRESDFCGMRRKEIEGGFDNFSFPFTLYLPKKSAKPVPVFVFAAHEYIEDAYTIDEKGNLVLEGSNKMVPFKDITDRGFGIAYMPTRGIYRDWETRADFRQGVFSAVHPFGGRKPNAWATISAWAWGTSRVLDYLETDADVDSCNVAVMGHSRGGKTALWAAATDTRFKLAVSNNSGCMGAAILRGKEGEHAKQINMTDWFCQNFQAYNDHEEMLPVDQHMLLALIAPRYIYVTSSVEDTWADPKAEFAACHLAAPAYKLYGCMKGLVAPEEAELEVPYHEGHIAYHVKKGDHSLTDYDWQQVMDYFEDIMKR